jgi:hypothetical protein
MKQVLVCLATLMLLASTLTAQTELKRVRLGNEAESMTYVSSGAYAGHIAIEDGMQVIGFPADGRGNAPARKLFDFSKLGFLGQPTGMGYLSDENLFVFTVVTQNSPTATLYLSDDKGNPAGNVVVNWPQEFADNNSYPEGIVWVPQTESRYPGCFIFAAIQQFGFENSFLVVNRSGEVVAKIMPKIDQTQVNFYPTGVGYRNGHLLVGNTDGNFYEFDLDGNIVHGPIHFTDASDIEGVTYASRSGRVALTANANAKVMFLDNDLNRLPEERSYRVGFGLSNAFDVAWSSSTSEFLVNALGVEPTLDLAQVAAINADITSARFVRTLSDFPTQPTRVEYMPDTNDFVLFQRSTFPRGFLFSDLNGNQTEFTALPNTLSPSSFTYIPGTRQFAIRRTLPANVLFIYDRSNLSGAPVRSINLATLGIASVGDVTYMHPEDPSGGQFLITTLDKFYVIDFAGNLLAQYANPMKVSGVGAITSGPNAGAFAGIYNPNNDLVLFTLP